MIMISFKLKIYESTTLLSPNNSAHVSNNGDARQHTTMNIFPDVRVIVKKGQSNLKDR